MVLLQIGFIVIFLNLILILLLSIYFNFFRWTPIILPLLNVVQVSASQYNTLVLISTTQQQTTQQQTTQQQTTGSTTQQQTTGSTTQQQTTGSTTQQQTTGSTTQQQTTGS